MTGTHRWRVLMVLGLCLLPLGAVWAQPVFQVRVDPYVPWAEGEYGHPATGGLAIELLDELARRMHLKMESKVVTFARALKLLEQGKADLIPVVVDQQERRQYMVFSMPVYLEPVLVYAAIDHRPPFAWEHWEDFTPYRIGIVRGYNYGEEWKVQSQQHAFRLDVVKDDLTNARKLAKGRIDLALFPRAFITALAHDHPALVSQFKASAKPVMVWVYRFGIAKTSFLAPRLAEVNGTLQAMQDDGTMRRILGAYYHE